MDGIGAWVCPELTPNHEIFFYRNEQSDVHRPWFDEGWWNDDGSKFKWGPRDKLIAPKCFSEW